MNMMVDGTMSSHLPEEETPGILGKEGGEDRLCQFYLLWSLIQSTVH